MPLWLYLQAGGTRAVEIAHRRWGKDDVALHWTARAAHQRTGTYWHMLPQAAQARKAIWDAVNPRTGRKRIDDAFPQALRKTTRANEMFIEFKCGSTWQVVGSDNFNSLMGSPPIGIVFSEWALADPRAWGFLSPIVEENGGWALFITTPRGRNHAHRSLLHALQDPKWFGEHLPATKTPVFTPEQLEGIKADRISDFGEEDGVALFEQEYLCSWDAPLQGAYYARTLANLEAAGHMVDNLPIEPRYPVETAWDLGWSDDTTIWWFQVVRGEVRVLDYYENHGQDIEHYCGVIHAKAEERGFDYGMTPHHWVPWDALPETLAAGGKTIVEQAWRYGVKMTQVPNVGKEQGIQAVRLMLPQTYFDKQHCADGLECLRNYQREWDDDKKVFKRLPLHNWASHAADGFRYLALAWKERAPKTERPPPPLRGYEDITMDELFEQSDRRYAGY